jgi:outer membrane lipoprotein carrier protein
VRVLLPAVMLVGAGVSSLAGQSPEHTLDRAIAAYDRVKTVHASFTQSLQNPLLGKTLMSHGQMVQEVPGRLSVRFTEPAGDRIVADGEWVWVYLPSSNPGQVIKMRAGESTAGTPDVTSQFLTSPKTRYTISDAGQDSVNGRPTHALRLIPKTDSLPFTRATIWVDDADGLVRQFETTDQNGVVRRVTITKLQVNAPVDRRAFRFTPPEGTRVFDQTGSR